MITNLGVGGKTYSPSEQNVSLFKAGMDSVRRMDKDGVRIGLRMSMCPRTITGNEGWKDFGLVRGLERPTQVGESESYPEQNISLAYAKRVTPYKLGVKILVSEEAFDREQYGTLQGRAIGSALMGKFQHAEDYILGTFISACGSTSVFTNPHGLAPATSALPTRYGTTSTDLGVTSLSWSALKSGVILHANMLDDNGDYVRRTGGYTLEVGIENMLLAEEILLNRNKPGTADRDINVVAAGSGHVTGHRVIETLETNRYFWTLVTNDEAQNPRFFWDVKGVSLWKEEKDGEGNYSWTYNRYMKPDFLDSRGIVYARATS